MGILAVSLTKSTGWAAASITTVCGQILQIQDEFYNSLGEIKEKTNTGHLGHPDKWIQDQEKNRWIQDVPRVYTDHLATLSSLPVLDGASPVRSSPHKDRMHGQRDDGLPCPRDPWQLCSGSIKSSNQRSPKCERNGRTSRHSRGGLSCSTKIVVPTYRCSLRSRTWLFTRVP